ncbi:flagellin [Chthonobacter rhizosphaerae]|uniref:flagellin N-terminal helical domain-containing protein n=1 Tax=Chthonobacter rhizosphaerae TaxID=2735553 RepID=UPI0015EF36E8|nr:flagellin [Chthonobacter rhizosphaerae]
MASILTNAAAQTALATLASIDKSIDKTSNRIASSLAVANAEDNAAYWSIATTMRSDNNSLSAVNDALGFGAATVDVQYTALVGAVDILALIKEKLVAAKSVGVDRNKIQADLTQLQRQLALAAESASFNGQNWLSVDSSSPGHDNEKLILSSAGRPEGAQFSVEYITVNTDDLTLFDPKTPGPAVGILDRTRIYPDPGGDTAAVSSMTVAGLTDAPADLARIENYVTIVDQALNDATDAAALAGATKKRISLQQSFLNVLRDSVDRSIAVLVETDLERDSTRLKALQTQQQLGIQALSIANGNASSILAFFKSP